MRLATEERQVPAELGVRPKTNSLETDASGTDPATCSENQAECMAEAEDLDVFGDNSRRKKKLTPRGSQSGGLHRAEHESIGTRSWVSVPAAAAGLAFLLQGLNRHRRRGADLVLAPGDSRPMARVMHDRPHIATALKNRTCLGKQQRSIFRGRNGWRLVQKTMIRGWRRGGLRSYGGKPRRWCTRRGREGGSCRATPAGRLVA